MGFYFTGQKQSPKDDKSNEKTGLSVRLTKGEMDNVSQLADALGISKAATVRMMLSIVSDGFTEKVKAEMKKAILKG